MKFACLSLFCLCAPALAFRPARPVSSTTALKGYLDDLKQYTYDPEADQPEEDDSREATQLGEEQKDRYGVGDWSGFVDGVEFDGGDGQMGVAGDGKTGLDKEWEGQSQMANSRAMSAKNAWGKSNGYADTLRDQGMDTQRAQQMENWMNQQEVLQARKQHRYMTEQFDQISADESWRDLSKFGVERNQDFDLDSVFGPVVPGQDISGTIELEARINQASVQEFDLKNSFMGFSDFRAAFTPDTPAGWSVEPDEGSLSGRDFTEFVVKFRPGSSGVAAGWLVVDTEEHKWTFKVIGRASM